MKISVVFGNDGSDVRIGKTCRSLVKLGHEVHFVGWDRRPDAPKKRDLATTVTHVLQHATPFGQWTWTGQWQYTWHVVRTLRRIRPDVACAVNEDNAVRLLPFRRLLFDRMICDVFDSHRDRGSNRPWPLRWTLSAISELARMASDTLIATDEVRFHRFGRHRRKTVVIGNYPEDPGDELARLGLTGPTKIGVCGTLLESRGLRQLLAAVEKTNDAIIVCAGWPNDEFAANVFINHPRVDYRGIVTSRKSLELIAGCDAVFAFYAPICRNNILASPNKIYDAMSVGRPVIINSEAEVSRWVVDESVGFACPYSDVQRLSRIVKSLHCLREDLAISSKRVRNKFLKKYSWEMMEVQLAFIYGVGDSIPTNAGEIAQAA